MCITVFCTFPCRRCKTTSWKCLISRFVEDGNTRQQLSFSFPELWYSTPKKIVNICRIKRDEISAMKFEAAWIRFFKWCFPSRHRRCCLSSLIFKRLGFIEPNFLGQLLQDDVWCVCTTYSSSVPVLFILYRKLPPTQTSLSLSLSRWKFARKGRWEGENERSPIIFLLPMVPCASSRKLPEETVISQSLSIFLK